MSDTTDRVKKIVVEHLGVEEDKVSEGASFIDDLGADSLDTVELVMAFEEEFGIEIPDDAAEKIATVKDAIKFIEANKQLGVEIKWFGSDEPTGFTSNHKSWKYFERQNLENSDRILSGLFDLRLPLTFSLDDCSLLSDIISECVQEHISDGSKMN